MLIYVLYFIFLAILAIQYQFTPFKSNILLFIIVILLAFLAGFQDTSVSKDYLNYQYLFDEIYDITDSGFYYLLAFEPGFVAIVVFFRHLFASNYGLVIMLFYALSSLTLKVYTINRLSINPYLTILYYFSYFFLLHEMTQIRIALASAIFLISLIPFLNEKRRVFVILILLATCFHYSAIFYLIILFFNTHKLNKNLYITLLFLSLILGVLKFSILSPLSNLDISDFSGKLNNYIEISNNGSIAVNVFNSLNILNILCCSYFLFFIKNQELEKDNRLVFFLK
ncbi:MAG TPA: EpsG family protein, partial [Hanamia sp.]|nr:EpsG family protein [Hanamia sp.]